MAKSYARIIGSKIQLTINKNTGTNAFFYIHIKTNFMSDKLQNKTKWKAGKSLEGRVKN